ncbi:hypothetical protein [Sphingomonas sp. GC_Shp_3]|uniref:hypothetical protein n=1 Tax=Sphingomonas sp. GC_Shp_3 TaxID=2937383 RepID=UPI002269ADD9|nr:hypothetical protein [Sphingomonas sp. GC_Shp_3]
MTLDRAALDAAAARSSRFAASFADHPVTRMLEHAFAGDDAEQLADAAELLLARGDWLAELLAPMVAELRADPLFEPPFEAQRDTVRFSTVLFERPAVTLTATIVSADALAVAPPVRSVTIAGRLSVIRFVRGGGARRQVWTADPADADFRAAGAGPCALTRDQPLADDMVVRLDGRTQGQVIAGATSDLVTVTATIRPGASPYVREYALADGALLRCAMLDEQPARTQMLLAYLRLAGRKDSGACFAAAAGDAAFFLRWPAMREWLALDAPAALPHLHAMAEADPHHEVRTAARATLAAITMRQGAAACHG